METKQPRLVVIVPCYNEQEVLSRTAPQFISVLQGLMDNGLVRSDSFLLFVDDGSRDETWKIISELSTAHMCVAGISQSRNRGHQYAIWTGLMEVRGKCDITITVDCDGQDDLSAMEEMVRAYHAGNEIVYGVRSSRKTDTFFKRTTAQTFYRFLSWMGAEVVYNHADYRLIGCQALEALSEFHEVNLFIRGLIPLVGFKSSVVEYERAERIAGDSHYPLRKMMGLAIDGVTSLSVKPLRMVTIIGFCVSMLSFVGIAWAVLMVVLGHVVSGWASMTCIICFVSGVQMMGIGVIGEYVGKIYLETKARPKSVISARVGDF